MKRIARPLRWIWSSLAGRLAVLLTVVVALVAGLSLTLAEQAHRIKITRLRMESVASNTHDIRERLGVAPAATEQLLQSGLVRHVRLVMPDGHVMQPDKAITALLQASLGTDAWAVGEVMPRSYCFPAGQSDDQPGGSQGWGSVPDCWLIRFVDPHGKRRLLTIGLPEYLSRRQDLIDPILLGIVIVLSASLVTLVTLLTIKPLRQLTRATEAFSVNAEPSPLPEAGPLEVRTAIATFNMMQHRVSEGHRQRTAMLAAISHDLQTPLTRMQLRLDDVEDPVVRARLEADVAMMQAIVREGLMLARSERSEEPWSMVDIDSLLASIVADAVDMGADVDLGKTSGLVLRTRPDALARCVGNLLENAIKYGGFARIDCHTAQSVLEIRVSDEGPGIAPDQIERMFEPFARAEQSRSRLTGGTGLGLAIARAQARLLGGDVSLENREGGDRGEHHAAAGRIESLIRPGRLSTVLWIRWRSS
ncbi:sensor histidine kinase [Novosphingobium sp. 9]|uniref:sensor histidine kinase n=1 Tax=Novosphingobium sp. 9 TaxID=2025349 RepID=UPI0021B55EE4|nr:ATP-binding protein [Novosphingobium sp. 9]